MDSRQPFSAASHVVLRNSAGIYLSLPPPTGKHSLAGEAPAPSSFIIQIWRAYRRNGRLGRRGGSLGTHYSISKSKSEPDRRELLSLGISS